MMKLGELADDMVYLAQALHVEQDELEAMVAARYTEALQNPDYTAKLVKLKRNPGRYFNRRR